MEKYTEVSDRGKVCYELINQCPMCNSSISPVEKNKFFNSDSNMCFFTYECPACKKGFISHYNCTDVKKNYAGSLYTLLELKSSYPKELVKQEFDDNIGNISPSFCEIYNQAYTAEQTDLNEIAGMGYRKALEFLIKDYCVYKNKSEEENIKNSLLGQVINNHIESEKIKNLAKASNWLGNDETHYVRKYEDKDIKDLKRFISATVAYITYELIADDAEEFVSN